MTSTAICDQGSCGIGRGFGRPAGCRWEDFPSCTLPANGDVRPGVVDHTRIPETLSHKVQFVVEP